MDLLAGRVQPYQWGDRSFIAELQGRRPGPRPEAELWLGAHPVAPSTLVASGCSLDEAVAADPAAHLGPDLQRRFGQLPFLLKVLAAAEPLSIQAHPSRAQAEAGYAREEAAGVAWDSPTRTYRDPNHKPELICALTPFEAKCGFRPLAATLSLVAELASTAAAGEGLAELARRLAAGASAPTSSLRKVLRWLYELPAERSAALVAEVVGAAGDLLAAGSGIGGDGPPRPELAWTIELDRAYPGDPGIVVALLLNHVVLAPGQALFLGAGNLHSYLRGAGVELMANSDNVVRGGLTAKHVDVAELAAIVDTEPGPAPVQTPVGTCHRFASPVPDFSLTRLTGPVDAQLEPAGAEIVLVTGGTATIELARSGERLPVGRGQAAFVSWADGRYRLVGDHRATIWRAAGGDPLT